MSREATRAGFKFFGGRTCLDFANSLNWRLTAKPVELLPDYQAFLDWSESYGTLLTSAIQALRARAVAEPASAKRVMEDARVLRAQLILTADALWSGQSPDTGFLDLQLRTLPAQPPLTREEGRFVFDLDGSDLRQPIWPVLWSLTAVLASSDADRIGSCRADGCGWFYADESPNRSRMWCCDACGNRERVRRAYAKRRSNP